jgi:SAM-dependent methyltransferase
MNQKTTVSFSELSVNQQRIFWDERYLTGTTGWDRGAPNPALIEWLDNGTLKPCRVLVPACGRGHEVIELARLRFTVTAVDYSAAALAALQTVLKANALEATLVNADLLTYAPVAQFDAIYEQTALCALAPAYWAAYAQRLHEWLVPGGMLYALFMQTEREGGPSFHCEVASMRGLFSTERWKWPDKLPHRIAHPSGLHELAVILEAV